MAKLDSALWRDIMDYLGRKHAPICRQWFEELRPIELDSGLLKVQTSTAVQQNYLQRKCLSQFTEAAQAATGALIAVRFVAPSSGDVLIGSLTPLEAPTKPAASSSRHGSASGNGHGQAHPQPATASQSTAQLSAPASTSAHAAHTTLSPVNPNPVPTVEAISFEQMVISPDYSFDNFVTGPNNQLAFAASVAVANQPGATYNPLFIHGGVGLGKTHLLQAVCQSILSQKPTARICYLSCDMFINHFLDCVQRNRMNEFRQHFRHVDVLVIDDIHFLADRERTQEEFFHTFNALYQTNRQIVLSSDSPPSEIPQLEERLVSRFQWGLVANVSKPSYETRVAIVRAKSGLRGLNLPDEVVDYIATRIDTNARELEGAITTIQGHASLQNRTIDLRLAHEALGEATQKIGMAQVTLQNIIHCVTAYYAVKLSDLQSKRRHKSITGPRQVAMWLARKCTRFSLEEIGAYFGGRDHTTVMHSIRIVDERAEADVSFAQQLTRLQEQITKS